MTIANERLTRLLRVGRATVLPVLADWRGGTMLRRFNIDRPDLIPTLGNDGAETKGVELALRADRAGNAAGAAAWAVELADVRLVSEEGDPSTHVVSGEEDEGVLDPLDGTTLFRYCRLLEEEAEIDPWGMATAILRAGRVQYGLLTQPARGVMFYSTPEGCFRLSRAEWTKFISGETDCPTGTAHRIADYCTLERKETDPLMISAPQSGKMQDEVTVDGFLELRKKLWRHKLLANDRGEGCAVGNAVLLLTGRLDAYVNFGGGTAWDLAAAGSAIELAGGWVSSPDGSPLVWDRLVKPVVFARSKAIGERLVDALR